jgi:hypothetical protein
MAVSGRCCVIVRRMLPLRTSHSLTRTHARLSDTSVLAPSPQPVPQRQPTKVTTMDAAGVASSQPQTIDEIEAAARQGAGGGSTMTKVRPFHPALVPGAEIHHGDIVAWQYGGTAPPESADARGPHPTFYRQVEFAHSSNDIINWKVSVLRARVLLVRVRFHQVDGSFFDPPPPPHARAGTIPKTHAIDSDRATRRGRTSRGTTARATAPRPRRAILSRGRAPTNSPLRGTNLGPPRLQHPSTTRAARTGPRSATSSISGAVGRHRPGLGPMREEGFRPRRPLHGSTLRRASSRYRSGSSSSSSSSNGARPGHEAKPRAFLRHRAR